MKPLWRRAAVGQTVRQAFTRRKEEDASPKKKVAGRKESAQRHSITQLMHLLHASELDKADLYASDTLLARLWHWWLFHNHALLDHEVPWEQRALDFFQDPHSSGSALMYAWATGAMILVSIALFCATTVPEFEMTAGLVALEGLITVFFTLEVAVRSWLRYRDRSLRAFATSPFFAVDVASCVSWYLDVGLDSSSIAPLRILRILRLFRFGSYNRSVRVAVRCVLRSGDAMQVTGFLMSLSLLLFSGLVYTTEQGNPSPVYASIPRSFWITVNGLATVGGIQLSPAPSEAPSQPLSLLVVGLVCVSGVLAFALPTAIIGENFAEERERMIRFDAERRNRLAARWARLCSDMMIQLQYRLAFAPRVRRKGDYIRMFRAAGRLIIMLERRRRAELAGRRGSGRQAAPRPRPSALLSALSASGSLTTRSAGTETSRGPGETARVLSETARVVEAPLGQEAGPTARESRAVLRALAGRRGPAGGLTEREIRRERRRDNDLRILARRAAPEELLAQAEAMRRWSLARNANGAARAFAAAGDARRGRGGGGDGEGGLYRAITAPVRAAWAKRPRRASLSSPALAPHGAPAPAALPPAQPPRASARCRPRRRPGSSWQGAGTAAPGRRPAPTAAPPSRPASGTPRLAPFLPHSPASPASPAAASPRRHDPVPLPDRGLFKRPPLGAVHPEPPPSPPLQPAGGCPLQAPPESEPADPRGPDPALARPASAGTAGRAAAGAASSSSIGSAGAAAAPRRPPAALLASVRASFRASFKAALADAAPAPRPAAPAASAVAVPGAKRSVGFGLGAPAPEAPPEQAAGRVKRTWGPGQTTRQANRMATARPGPPSSQRRASEFQQRAAILARFDSVVLEAVPQEDAMAPASLLRQLAGALREAAEAQEAASALVAGTARTLLEVDAAPDVVLLPAGAAGDAVAVALAGGGPGPGGAPLTGSTDPGPGPGSGSGEHSLGSASASAALEPPPGAPGAPGARGGSAGSGATGSAPATGRSARRHPHPHAYAYGPAEPA
eukprot:tig00001384_g8556.t1